MPEASGGGSTKRALLAGVVVFSSCSLALTAIVTHHQLDHLDRFARLLVHQSGPPILLPAMTAVSFLGGQAGQITVICLGSLALWQRRRGLWALTLPAVMAGAGLLQFFAKWAVARPRPNLDPWGFPSAHVLSLVVLCGYLSYIVGTSRAGRSWGRPTAAIAAAIVAVVAYSRMYLDAHWLSDVLGGITIGFAYLLVVISITRSKQAIVDRGTIA
jgi:membrane-associated phospholipid phosphatase